MTALDISKIEIDAGGRLLVYPQDGNIPLYEYVYRAAKGVYWNRDMQCLYMKEASDWTYGQIFENIMDAVKSELGISLSIEDESEWKNIADDIKLEIKNN